MPCFPALHLTFLAIFLLGSLDFLPRVAGSLPGSVVIDSQLLTSKVSSTNKTIIVDISGNGDFKSVQAAVDAVEENNSEWIIIHVRAGVYREKVIIQDNKPYIFMRGNGKGKTSIIWNDSASKNDTFNSATFSVYASNFVAWGISFKNEAPVGVAGTSYNQSVAALVAGDKSAFYRCGFHSLHNTLFDFKGRHYYENCYIQGSIDFIFGRGQSLFHSCEVFVIPDSRVKIHGSIAAHNRQSPDENSGIVFWKGKVYGVGFVYLGRPRGPYSRVIFAKTYLSKTVVTEGWTNWSFDGETKNILYGEYHTFGPGSSPAQRVSWSRQLTEEEVAPFMTVDYINGKEWLPIY